jgi:hypothetical protein
MSSGLDIRLRLYQIQDKNMAYWNNTKSDLKTRGVSHTCGLAIFHIRIMKFQILHHAKKKKSSTKKKKNPLKETKILQHITTLLYN